MFSEAELTYRVLVADDDAFILEAISTLLDSLHELKVVGTAQNGLEAIRLTKEHEPDVVIIDLMMPDMDGLTATKIIKETFPQIKVIALTAVEQPSEIMGCLLNGIDGYLLKRVTKEELRLAISLVMKGQRYLCHDVTNLIFESYAKELQDPKAPAMKITAREREVLDLMCLGLRGKIIADRLSISIKTVEKHIANVRSKLKVNTVAEMAVAYIRWKETGSTGLLQK